MIDWTLTVLRRYAQFTGRAGRTEYWWYALTQLLVATVIGVLTVAIPMFVFVLYVIILATIVPGFAVTVRRLHDVGHPGSYLFFYLIPFVGPILMLVWLTTLSDGPNAFGQGPEPPLLRSLRPTTPSSITSGHSNQSTSGGISLGFVAQSPAHNPMPGGSASMTVALECPGCSTGFSGNERFCTQCGTALPIACRQCNQLPTPGDRFCRGCGAPL